MFLIPCIVDTSATLKELSGYYIANFALCCPVAALRKLVLLEIAL